MVKTYLKYLFSNQIGLVTGNVNPVVHVSGKYIVTSVNSTIIIINAKSFTVCQYLNARNESKSEISVLEISENYLFVGYSKGYIEKYKLSQFSEISEFIEIETTFSLHKSEITSLQFDEKENQLISASKDGIIYLWDCVSESVLFKFSGHKDSIIKIKCYNLFSEEGIEYNLLVSCSKDNSLKIWNRSTQECLQTISNLVNKINNFEIYENMLILGTYDQKFSIYKLQVTKSKKEFENSNLNILTIAHLKGSVTRKSSAKITDITVFSNILSVFSKDKSVEFFKILSDTEVENRLTLIECKKEIKNSAKIDELKLIDKCSKHLQCEDYNLGIKFYSLFNFNEEFEIFNVFYINSGYSNKLKDFKICFGTKNNLIQVYEVKTNIFEKNLFKNFKKVKNIDTDLNKYLNPEIGKNIHFDHYLSIDIGHRETLRFLKFSSSNSKFLSLSQDCIRIWNYKNLVEKETSGFINFDKKSLNMINPQYSSKYITIPEETPLTASFLKSDEYIVCGTKSGSVFLIDSNSCEIISGIKAHEGEIWNVISLKVKDIYYAVTCSSDKKINYFKINFEELIEKKNVSKFKNNEENDIEIEIEENNIIELVNSLDTTDQISYMMISPNKKYLVYSLLDNSVRILHSDSGKQYLSLYGHKLPVLTFDISSDNSLIITGSSDKNIKIWGMDFGDCHKSLFAHYEAITCVKFVNKTHYFFSSSKDGVVKYWDGDDVRIILKVEMFNI